MKRKELLGACEALVKSYDPNIMTVDAHVDEALADVPDADRLFLHQVLYGCVRYKDVLKVFLANFYMDNSAKTSRNDYTKFMILAYLSIFRLGEIGIGAFKSIVSSQNPTSMHVFLAYLFDQAILQGPVQAEWIRLLDQAFVEKEMIAKMLVFKHDIDSILDHLHAKAFGMAAARETLKANGGIVRVASKEPTIPIAPNLTKPKPRPIAEPIRIPLEIKANPVPELNKLTLSDLETQQKQRREAAKQEVLKKYEESSAQPFKLEETRSNLDAIKKEVEDARMAELKLKFKAKPAPLFTDKDAPVKLNTAAILREDALYKKKQEKEAKILQAYESDLRDASEFYRWQSDMIKKDDEDHRRQVEMRRLEMAQAQHEAIEASLRAKAENREVAIQMKLVARENDEKRRQEENELNQQYQQIATDIKQTREVAPREAEERVRLENARKREELNIMLEAERQRKAEQDAIDQAQREDLIRQIRALDRVHREHVAVFDPTESSNYGLLEEMSLVELRERLQMKKVQEAEWEAERREHILECKKDKEEDLKSRVQNIARIRQSAATANRAARARKKELEQEKLEKEKQMRDEGNLKLAAKMTKQRAEREAEARRLRDEEELIANKRMFLGAAKNMLEERHFMQQSLGAEREATIKQRTTQTDARTDAATKLMAKNVRHLYRHQQALLKEHEFAVKDELNERATLETKARLRNDKDHRKATVRHEKNRRLHANEILQNRNAYATEISKTDVGHGRRFDAAQSSNQLDA
ncbi:hypothetical protein SDRG_04862 [Saprolegnia diclina VS20]|uniref:Uncharacterized protein n=1 Tax=Saprolegnia diclina (strain VS20) TaxID=1156394 RepID=T0QIK5_SAPDV|nr:hypothetical protein SDRG_04862 [Saprolegnia diclina VS20]EQC37839.1 hypothetical protein SDRG_04862 [Saprolegnia diclina VS20]|eukprot:XP_008608772.1 hypothetical protein SDRG_04862 [Saprolegnia diclina VS20]